MLSTQGKGLTNKKVALANEKRMGRISKSGNIAVKYASTKKQGVKHLLPNPLFLFGEPCRDRTDNLLIKSHIF